MIKEHYPILEFDETKDALINPKIQKNLYDNISPQLIVCFFKDAIETLLKDGVIYLKDVLKGENEISIYQFKDRDITLIPGKLGAPACAGFLEDFIALGAKNIIFCGGGGVLRSDLTVGKLIVIDQAIRDEGTSYHYIKPSREIAANPHIVKKITEGLDSRQIDYIVGKTWTTDAFYRETPKKIALRKSEGALIVEMEQAAMIAVSKFRNVNYGAIIYGGDDISQSNWDSRGWRNRKEIRLELTKLCTDLVFTFECYNG